MGYYSTIYGSLEIHPPLTWGDIQNFPEFLGNDLDVFKIELDEFCEDTEIGVLHRKEGVEVVPVTDDHVKAYSAVENLQKIVDAYPEHEFIGEFRIEGEETGDIKRLVLEGRKIKEITPEIVWPDGRVEMGRR